MNAIRKTNHHPGSPGHPRIYFFFPSVPNKVAEGGGEPSVAHLMRLSSHLGELLGGLGSRHRLSKHCRLLHHLWLHVGLGKHLRLGSCHNLALAAHLGICRALLGKVTLVGWLGIRLNERIGLGLWLRPLLSILLSLSEIVRLDLRLVEILRLRACLLDHAVGLCVVVLEDWLLRLSLSHLGLRLRVVLAHHLHRVADCLLGLRVDWLSLHLGRVDTLEPAVHGV